MNKTIPYKTPRQLCEAVSELSNVETLNLTRRPKFRFKPDECPWWLVPSTENPHYKHGKLIFAWEDKKSSKISAGIQIEKGLDEQIKSVYSSKKASKFIMEEPWLWSKFIEYLNADSFFSKCTEALNSMDNLTITIDGGYVSEPTKFDPYQEKSLGWDKYTFTWNKPDKDSLILVNAKRSAYVLKLHHIKTISDLQKILIELNKDPWLWINFYITTPLTVSRNTNDENSSALNIWENYLSSFKFILE
jgi:hypothetical protein